MKNRRTIGRALTEIHYRLRTEGSNPMRRAIAIGLGTWIGMIPVYGLHLLICAVVARLFRLSRTLTYLAAHINNPITAPFLLWAEFGLGQLLRTGRWPRLALAEARNLTVWNVGANLVLGGVILGFALGLVLGGLACLVAVRGRSDSSWRRILEETSKRYVGCGVFHWEFVRGKLRHDPLYRRTLIPGLLPRDGRLLDLGCGRGILLAVLGTVRGFGGLDTRLELIGVESNTRLAAVARRAVASDARIQIANLANYEPVPCSVAVLFDVLHYLDPAAQERLLARLCGALRPGGLLLVREMDDQPPWRFRLTRWQERCSAWMRREWGVKFHFRPAREWKALLERHGMEVEISELWRGTPFSNVLLQAVKR